MPATSATDWFDAAVAACRTAGAVVRALAFWAAALLPVAYVPLVLADHPVVADPPVIGTLVTLNVAALFVGHGHRRPAGGEGDGSGRSGAYDGGRAEPDDGE